MKCNTIFGLRILAAVLIPSTLFASKSLATETVKLSDLGGKTVIDLNKSTGSGYLTLIVFSADRKVTYWELNLNYYDGGRIWLGEVPHGKQRTRDGNQVMIRQASPSEDSPKIPTGEELIIYVQYRSDLLGIVPGAKSTEVRFTLDANHRLIKAPNKAE